MVNGINAILIWSEDYRALADWYVKMLDLKIDNEENHPDDTGVNFLLGDFWLWIGKHSEVKGKNKDNCRIMFNFTVDSVSETYEELKRRGVKFLAAPFKAPTFDKYFATFYDLDDNLVQLIGGK